jgi:hypothetical protein
MTTNQTVVLRTYSELITIAGFKERYNYLKLTGFVGTTTFGFDRYINQEFYRSREWKRVRRDVILRDNGNDLGVDGYMIGGVITVHHMNPIRPHDLLTHDISVVMNPEFLISVSHLTHQAIHFGSEKLIPQLPVQRKKGDTKLW